MSNKGVCSLLDWADDGKNTIYKKPCGRKMQFKNMVFQQKSHFNTVSEEKITKKKYL